jgi:hypothetical protein
MDSVRLHGEDIDVGIGERFPLGKAVPFVKALQQQSDEASVRDENRVLGFPSQYLVNDLGPALFSWEPPLSGLLPYWAGTKKNPC